MTRWAGIGLAERRPRDSVTASTRLSRRPAPGMAQKAAASAPKVRRPPVTLLMALAAAASTMVACLLRYGYDFGIFDHTVLSVRGIALADPDAMARDWFARSVPQPHWLFDLITYAGERVGVLPWFYLAYWLASLAAFGVGATWLAQRLLPDRVWSAILLGPVVVLGPEAILGSTTPLLGIAIPHMLGACLAFLSITALITERWRLAAGIALATCAVHVQHGALLAPILIGVAALERSCPKPRRRELGAAAAVVIVNALVVADLRGLQTTGDEWRLTCERFIPFHCDAATWDAAYLASGALVIALALLFAALHSKDWRRLLPAVMAPALGLAGAVVGERYQLDVVGQFAQQFNLHRLAALVAPFAAMALLVLIVRPPSGSSRGTTALVAALLSVMWMTTTAGSFKGPWSGGGSENILFALALGAVAAVVAWRFAFARTPQTQTALSTPFRVLASTLVLAVVGISTSRGNVNLGHVGYDRSNPVIEASLTLRWSLPSDAVIAAHPGISWLRAISRRSVVADCKSIPYGGPLWYEYLVRIEAVGGFECSAEDPGIGRLSIRDVERLHQRYGVTHVLLFGDDAKLPHAYLHWDLVHEFRARDFPFLEKGWFVFEVAS